MPQDLARDSLVCERNMAGIRLKTVDICGGVIYILALLLKAEQHTSFVVHVYLLHDVLAWQGECQIDQRIGAAVYATTRPRVLASTESS